MAFCTNVGGGRWVLLSKTVRSHGWRSSSVTWAQPSAYEAKLHATAERPQSVIAGRTPKGGRRSVFWKAIPNDCHAPTRGRLGPEPNHYTSRKTLAPKQPQRLSFQAEHQTGNPNAETVPVQRQRRQNRKMRNRLPGLLSHGQTLADPPAL